MKLISLIVLFILANASIFAQNIKIDKYVIASSANISQNQNNIFFNTVGQFAIGKFIYSNSILYSGFWEANNVKTSVESDNILAQDRNSFVFPNPASDYIEIRQLTEGSKPSVISEIKIYNTFGECVLNVGVELALPKSTRAELALPLQKIDISHLPVGLYFIQIGNYTEKFIVVR